MDGRYSIYVANQQAIEAEKQKLQEEARQKTLFRKERFLRYGLAGILYTLFYTFCLYKNESGITYPVYVIGTLCFYCYCMGRTGIALKKESIFYMVATVLLGISNVLTDNWIILFFNRRGIFLLFINFLLVQYYDDLKWSFGYYLTSMCRIVWGALTELFSPYLDFFSFLKLRNKEKDGKVKYVAAGILIGLPFVGIVLCLLSSADKMFGYLFTEGILDTLAKINIWGSAIGILWKLFLGMGLGYAFIAFLEKRSLPVSRQKDGQGEPVLGITITVMLAFVYVLFCGVQIIGLFGGMVMLPENYNYAEYAREGFFQLLFVSFMNLVLVMFCLGYFRKNRVLQILLTVISLCTYIMIASSAFRMILYIKSYYLTFLRILVLWALMVIAIFMAGVLCRIYKKDFRLFRYGTVVVTICYLLLSFARPDYMIAKYNLSAAETKAEENQWQDGMFSTGEEHDVDWFYLYGLSADAAPVLYGWETGSQNKRLTYYEETYYESARENYWYTRNRMADRMGIRGWNLSRFLGGQYFDLLEQELN